VLLAAALHIAHPCPSAGNVNKISAASKPSLRIVAMAEALKTSRP
jgi:hypothetical protein